MPIKISGTSLRVPLILFIFMPHISSVMKKTLLSILTLLACISALAQESGYAVVNLSVCNLRRTPDFDAEMTTQALLGTPVHVLGKDGWYHIQTPDTYTGWVHTAGIHVMSFEEYHDWNAAEKIVITALCGLVYSAPDSKSQSISDVVGGDRLRYLGRKGRYFKVGFPDGRVGYVSRKAGMKETDWRKSVRSDAAAVIATAKTMLGFPYLWAGMSPKGMDCSGFVRTTLYIHDIIIPRDASQQAPKGERITIDEDFGNLLPGDLIFFGRRGEDGERDRVSHVAIYIGGKEFIHSLGSVRINSFDPEADNYDEYDLSRLLYASRVLPYIDRQDGLCTTATNEYYNE